MDLAVDYPQLARTKENEIAMKKDDARHFAKAIAKSKEAILRCDDETGPENCKSRIYSPSELLLHQILQAEKVIGDDAKAIKGVIKEDPVLATKILEDDTVKATVQSIKKARSEFK
ncbi:MAG: hypothetical protein Q9221_003602 [Calogaya cf. arnoldii]